MREREIEGKEEMETHTEREAKERENEIERRTNEEKKAANMDNIEKRVFFA